MSGIKKGENLAKNVSFYGIKQLFSFFSSFSILVPTLALLRELVGGGIPKKKMGMGTAGMGTEWACCEGDVKGGRLRN